MLNVTSDADRLYALLDKLYNMFTPEHYSQGRQVTQVCGGAAIKTAISLTEGLGGRIMYFGSSISSLGFGKVQSRSKPELFNSANELKGMIAPEHDAFQKMAEDCIRSSTCVDLFFATMAGQVSIDLATMVPVCGRTGGDLIYFEDFDVYNDGETLYYRVFRNMTRDVATDVMFKMRVSTGLTNTDYIGSFDRVQSSDMAISAVDQDKTITCLFRNDDTLKEGQPAYAQFAMLHTRADGTRMIRILNYTWKVCKNLYNYFKSADVENYIQFKMR